MFALGLGGAALGFLEKSFPSLPTLPIIGRKGTIALACYYFSKGKGGHSLLRDVAIAASTIAGYELGTTGKISGEDVDHNVRGVAAQV
jgi:hypothetical protein